MFKLAFVGTNKELLTFKVEKDELLHNYDIGIYYSYVSNTYKEEFWIELEYEQISKFYKDSCDFLALTQINEANDYSIKIESLLDAGKIIIFKITSLEKDSYKAELYHEEEICPKYSFNITKESLEKTITHLKKIIDVYESVREEEHKFRKYYLDHKKTLELSSEDFFKNEEGVLEFKGNVDLNPGSDYYEGNIYINPDLDIVYFPNSLTITGSLVTGKNTGVICKRYIRVLGDIHSDLYLKAESIRSRDIFCSGSIESEFSTNASCITIDSNSLFKCSFLNAKELNTKGNVFIEYYANISDDLVVDGDLRVGTKLNVQDNISVGEDITAESVDCGGKIECFGNINVKYGIGAVYSILCRHTITVGTIIYAGLILTSIPSKENKLIMCERLTKGKVIFGKLKKIKGLMDIPVSYKPIYTNSNQHFPYYRFTNKENDLIKSLNESS